MKFVSRVLIAATWHHKRFFFISQTFFFFVLRSRSWFTNFKLVFFVILLPPIPHGIKRNFFCSIRVYSKNAPDKITKQTRLYLPFKTSVPRLEGKKAFRAFRQKVINKGAKCWEINSVCRSTWYEFGNKPFPYNLCAWKVCFLKLPSEFTFTSFIRISFMGNLFISKSSGHVY